VSARTHSFGNAFIGRDDTLRELDRSVQSAQAFTTVVGPPGVGKTRLLHEWASSRPERATHRISLVSLSTREEITNALSRAPRGALLLLDNAEHVARSLAEVWTEWRCESPGARAVATSRSRVGVDDELVVPLAPLRAQAALSLWRARLRERIGREPPWRAEDARLLERLQGLPLAIEVVVSSLSTYSADDLLRNFELVMRATTPDAASDEPRSLADALATSWNLLSLGDRRALVCASLTTGGFDDAFAAEVFAADAIGARGHRESLVEQSLLTRNGERLDVLEAVRAFALGIAAPRVRSSASDASAETGFARSPMPWSGASPNALRRS
jgi:predicted ATPase